MMRKSQEQNVERALPEGKILVQKYLYKLEIKKAVDRVKLGALDSYLETMSVAVETIMKLLKVSNPYALVGATVGWAIEFIRVKPYDWWKDSYFPVRERTTIIKISFACYLSRL